MVRECVASLDLFSLGSFIISKRSFTSEIVMPLELSEAYFESKKWTASFEKGTAKEEVLSELCNNGVLKARVRQSL